MWLTYSYAQALQLKLHQPVRCLFSEPLETWNRLPVFNIYSISLFGYEEKESIFNSELYRYKCVSFSYFFYFECNEYFSINIQGYIRHNIRDICLHCMSDCKVIIGCLFYSKCQTCTCILTSRVNSTLELELLLS